jgi:putative tryptophan/tyrosine transport system substrate-binding protein
MTRRIIGLLIILAHALLVPAVAAEGQRPAHVYRIGILAPQPWSPFEVFRHELHDLGYREGQNLILESRWAEGQYARLPAFAAELVRLPVDIIVTWGTPAALAAQRATATIPIVMAAIGDAVGAGLVTSLARPGGNITGLTAINPDLEGKRLEFLKAVVPQAARIALLWNPANSHLHTLMVHETQRAAQALGLQVHPVEAGSASGFEPAFAAMAEAHAEALIVAPDAEYIFHRAQIAALAAKYRLPAVYVHRDHVEAGGLMAYTPDYDHLFRRAASYVDKILKGTKPGDLPVEQATTFELVINLKTADALGITIPPMLLFQATEVIR